VQVYFLEEVTIMDPVQQFQQAMAAAMSQFSGAAYQAFLQCPPEVQEQGLTMYQTANNAMTPLSTWAASLNPWQP
jgi:hypothetical protein